MSRSERCRQLDRLGSKAFHPLVLTSPLERNLALAEHLVRQTPDGVHVDIVADDTLDTAPSPTNSSGRSSPPSPTRTS